MTNEEIKEEVLKEMKIDYPMSADMRETIEVLKPLIKDTWIKAIDLALSKQKEKFLKIVDERIGRWAREDYPMTCIKELEEIKKTWRQEHEKEFLEKRDFSL